MERRIALIGAGPAGLAAALAGRQLGMAVRVYEQAEGNRPVGGGLMVHRNGLRALDTLGALDGLLPSMRFATRLHLRAAGGRLLSSTDLGEVSPPQNRAAVILRSQLQTHLLGAAEQAGAVVEFGRRVVGVTVQDGEAAIRFDDGTGVGADVVVAADGVHSAVRGALGLPARKVAMGEAYVRGVAEVESPVPDIQEFWAGDGRRFGICPLPGRQTYFFASAPVGGAEAFRNARLPQWVESWHDFGPNVAALLRHVPDWNRVNYSELYEVRMGRWHRPPVFLIGDAAHAMTPNLGQGANAATVDALVLMRMLAEPGGDDLARVARRHEAIRRRHVVKTQTMARHVGQLAGPMWGPLRRARDLSFGLSARLPAARRSLLRTLVGDNPREEPYLDRPVCDAATR